jgi:hypothetical protein
MTLSRIVMRLARNPGTEFADGDDHRGYTLTAPLTEDGMLNLEAFQKSKADCTVRRFAPDEDVTMGLLARRRDTWYFDYDDTIGLPLVSMSRSPTKRVGCWPTRLPTFSLSTDQPPTLCLIRTPASLNRLSVSPLGPFPDLILMTATTSGPDLGPLAS